MSKEKFIQFGPVTKQFSCKQPNTVEVERDYFFSEDYEEYLDAIIENRRRALQERLEKRSIKANSIHRGTKE